MAGASSAAFSTRTLVEADGAVCRFCRSETREHIRSVVAGRESGDTEVVNFVLCRVLRDIIPPTPPGPEGSNGNGS